MYKYTKKKKTHTQYVHKILKILLHSCRVYEVNINLRMNEETHQVVKL